MATWSKDDARRLFERAAGADVAGREAILSEVEATDPTLADEVRSLLLYHDRASGVLDTPAAGVMVDEAPLPTGTVLGRYTIVRELGRGGMGVVYEAQQDYPKRPVALKLMRPDLVSAAAMRRFSHEAEALALLHHEGIAQVHDAGTFRDGAGASVRPFLAMELIEGRTLGRWSREASPGLREKVHVMARVCDAVEHAHQRGVVHRDLKPGNIMVTEGGQPKVLDFGVARLTQQGVGAAVTISTSAGQIIGTLRYMSPEQAGGGAGGDPRAVDSRSDVYALGAILYELLTGKPPIDVDSVSVAEAVRRITSDEPPTVRTVAREIPSDLETIVRHAMAKEAGRRYQHASDLALDLRHWLNDETISVRPPSLGENVRRLVRRHRGVAAGVGIAALALVIGATVAVWQAVRATREAANAKAEAEVSAATLRYMEKMIASGTPAEDRGQDMTVREMVKAASATAFSEPDTLVSARAHFMLASAMGSLGEFTIAERHALRARDIDLKLRGPDASETIEDQRYLANCWALLGKEREAVTLARETLDHARAVLGPDHETTLNAMLNVAYCLSSENPSNRPEIETRLKELIEVNTRVRGPEHYATNTSRYNLGVFYGNHGRADEGIPILLHVLKNRESESGADHTDTILVTDALAAAYFRDKKLDLGKPYLDRTVEATLRVYGPDHPRTIGARTKQLQWSLTTGTISGAEPVAYELWQARVRKLGHDHRLTLNSKGLYVNILITLRKLELAEPLAREMIETADRLFGPKDEDALITHTLMYDLYEAKGDKEGMAKVAAYLKGTPYDPAVVPAAPVPKDLPAGTPK